MADCGFSTQLSNGAKAGILGLLIGGFIAAFKGLKGSSRPSTPRPPPPSTPHKGRR